MSNLFEAIENRRSIRKYQSRTVPESVINEILKAAGWAPSAHNAQPWRFIVLDDALVKRDLAEAMAESWATDIAKDGLKIEANVRKLRVERFATAPALLLACLTMDGMNKHSNQKGQTAERDLAMQSLGAALQNMLLAAHEKGLGACLFCAPGFCKQTVRKVLKIPDDIDPETLIVMGYAAEKPATPARKVLSEYSFKDKWDKRLN